MHIYRRGQNGDPNQAVHKNKRNKGSARRPGEVKAHAVGRLAKKRNSRDLRMPGSYVGKTPAPKDMSKEEQKKLNKRLADGDGCVISLIFMGLSTGIIGSLIYSAVQYLS